MNKSHLTARARKTITKPIKWLWDNGFISNTARGLDYGCGKAIDADTLGWAKYDPYYQCIKPYGYFDVIACTYVLNVLEPIDRAITLQNIAKLLTDKGKAFITVRRDIEKAGYTRRGTYQVIVELPYKKLVENKSFCIYEVSKKELDKMILIVYNINRS